MQLAEATEAKAAAYRSRPSFIAATAAEAVAPRYTCTAAAAAHAAAPVAGRPDAGARLHGRCRATTLIEREGRQGGEGHGVVGCGPLGGRLVDVQSPQRQPQRRVMLLGLRIRPSRRPLC